MTVRELIKELKNLDDDVMDYQVWVTLRIQLTDNVRLSAKANIKVVPENVDVDAECLYLKTEREVS